jgi:phosphate acetyltransferase/phosphate butyryltransferase
MDTELNTVRRAGARLEALVVQAAKLPPLRTAVVHPVDDLSLAGALAARDAGLIEPVLVGPAARIRVAAASAGLDLSGIELVATPHSHAAAAAAVSLARGGEVAALMKGALHTDELMRAALDSAGGLRTGRRVSHVFVCDTSLSPRLLLITDAAVNIYPTLADKRDIVQNAIDLAHALGVARPNVALLSAVEVVTEQIRSTLDAAALCKMADRGQITGGVLDGPLAFDNAVSLAAATAKGIHSPVAGVADILVVPDLEAGNMLAKQLEYLAGAVLAGVAIGTRVPIILTSRADPTVARLSSAAIARLYAAQPTHYVG